MIFIVPSCSVVFYCLPDSVQFNSVNLLTPKVVGTKESEISYGPDHQRTS